MATLGAVVRSCNDCKKLPYIIQRKINSLHPVEFQIKIFIFALLILVFLAVLNLTVASVFVVMIALVRYTKTFNLQSCIQ